MHNLSKQKMLRFQDKEFVKSVLDQVRIWKGFSWESLLRICEVSFGSGKDLKRIVIQPAREARKGCYCQSVPAQWGGARLFAASEGHPHGNGRNSETKSLKMDPKVPNRPPSRGLQTGHWRNPGSYGKKRIFGPKSGPVAGKRPGERPNGH